VAYAALPSTLTVARTAQPHGQRMMALCCAFSTEGLPVLGSLLSLTVALPTGTRGRLTSSVLVLVSTVLAHACNLGRLYFVVATRLGCN